MFIAGFIRTNLQRDASLTLYLNEMIQFAKRFLKIKKTANIEMPTEDPATQWGSVLFPDA